MSEKLQGRRANDSMTRKWGKRRFEFITSFVNAPGLPEVLWAGPSEDPEDRLQICVATSNKGKLAEYGLLLAPLDCEILSTSRPELMKLGFRSIRDPVEDGETYFQNAYIKARYWADILGIPCLADDSGLSVKALGGEPGVNSARWGDWQEGVVAPQEQSGYLIKKMEGIADRSAAFVTSIVVAKPFRREALHYQGALQGEVTHEVRGILGFGYDYAFLVPELGLTLAELSTPDKNAISHRGKAARALREDWDRVKEFLKEYLPEPASGDGGPAS
jgi:XTP/dITP diphosphohydrolase